MNKNILATLATCLLFLSANAQKKMNIEQAVGERFTTFAVEDIEQLQWVGTSEYYSYVEDKSLYLASVKGKAKRVVSSDELDRLCPTPVKSMPQVHWLNKDQFWFQNGQGYFLFSGKKKTVSKLLETEQKAANADYHEASNHLAYTIDNDLWVNVNGKDQVVKDNEDGIVSGQAYARWEFGIRKGTFWSNNGTKLAFYEKDERHVPEYPLVDYSQGPATVMPTRYPFSGTHAEHASVGIYNVDNNRTTYLNLENGRKDDSFYATNLAWDPDNKHVYLAILNRAQDHMWLKKFNAETGEEVATLFEETDKEYIEPERPPLFVPGMPDQFLWFSERNGFDNLYLYNSQGKQLARTNFAFPITSVIGFDNKGGHVFVQTTASIATESQLFKITIPDLKHQRITKAAGVHSGEIGGGGKYVIDTWSNVDTPRKIDLLTSTGKMIRNLLTAPDPLTGYSMSKAEMFELPAADGTPLWCRMIKPSDFDEKTKYPVVVYVYNGPHAQMIDNRWLAKAPLWMYSLAEEGCIVFTVDGRGSAQRGIEFEQMVFEHLGDLEMEDQEHCANWLKDQPYTDPDRFAVHGWSYGGFMTTSMMLRKPGLFKVGVAGGPVIDWSYYEVMYTERYMNTPEENPEGYAAADLKNYVSDLQGDLLIIHGSIDDTVVPQHSMDFLRECVSNGVQCDFFLYPMHAHNVRGKDRVHLMKNVIGYIMDHL